MNALTVTVSTVSAKVDARFDAVDARFDEVTWALIELGQYTEFGFDRLRGEMLAGCAGMTANFGRLDRKLDHLIDRLVRRDPDT